MSTTIRIALAALAVCSLQASMVLAQAGGASTVAQKQQPSVEQDIQLLRQDLRSGKKHLIAANLRLTDVEATKFWPVYDQYQAEYSKIGDAKMNLIKDYAEGWGTLSDDQALSLLKRLQDTDQSLLELRNKYVPIFSKVLPGKKVATFFQMDRRIEALLNVQMASQIPLVQDQQPQ